MKLTAYRLVEVTSFPRPLEHGVLYVSARFSVSAHLCACGCAREVILPLNPAQWSVVRHADGTATLEPSVANTGYPCNSHYFIRRGRVEWGRPLTRAETERVRVRDKRARDAHFRAQQGLLQRVWFWVRGLW